VALARLLEQAGDLGGAEAALGRAGEVALSRGGRLAPASKATFRHLHRVYLAQVCFRTG
jgi:hypothetical protein